MFMGITMFWAPLKFILAQAAGQVWKGFLEELKTYSFPKY